jgi:hypothetical protein
MKWRRVQYDWQRTNERRAQGFLPVVQVCVASRPDPIELGFVTTRLTHTIESDGPGESPPSGRLGRSVPAPPSIPRT